MKKIIVFIFVCMLLILIAFPVSGTITIDSPTEPILNGNIIYVGGSGPNNYTTIQGGVDAAHSGDTVFVYDDSSPYYENVEIEKTINLIGEDKETTVVDGRNGGFVFRITDEYINISGFTITNGTEDGVVINGIHATISGNIINNNSITGVVIMMGYATVTKNIFTQNGYESSNGPVFISLSGSHKISNNNFIDNKGNMFFWRSTLNLWYHNYWDRPRLFPKPLFGFLILLPPIPWLQWDIRPALEPNDI